MRSIEIPVAEKTYTRERRRERGKNLKMILSLFEIDESVRQQTKPLIGLHNVWIEFGIVWMVCKKAHEIWYINLIICRFITFMHSNKAAAAAAATTEPIQSITHSRIHLDGNDALIKILTVLMANSSYYLLCLFAVCFHSIYLVCAISCDQEISHAFIMIKIHFIFFNFFSSSSSSMFRASTSKWMDNRANITFMFAWKNHVIWIWCTFLFSRSSNSHAVCYCHSR